VFLLFCPPPVVETVSISFILRLFNDIPSTVVTSEKLNMFAGEVVVAYHYD
jgi:hypothetical protein